MGPNRAIPLKSVRGVFRPAGSIRTKSPPRPGSEPERTVERRKRFREQPRGRMRGHDRTRIEQGQGGLWVLLLAAFGAALVSLLALLQWDNTALSDERGDGNRAALEPGTSFKGQLAEATGRGDIEPQIVGG